MYDYIYICNNSKDLILYDKDLILLIELRN